MNKGLIAALVKTIVDSRIETLKDEIELKPGRPGPRGFRGYPGRDGDSFSLEENKEYIDDLINQYLKKVKSDLRLKFNDLTDQEKNSLKLKYQDLTDQEKEQLRGPKGRDGRNGKSIVFDDIKDSVYQQIEWLFNDRQNELKIKFSDLTDDERESLRLKFEHLTCENKLELKGEPGERGTRGYRGQRGKRGDQGPRGHKGDKGDKGEKGDQGIRGIPGTPGIMGQRGLPGKDGQDAPKIVQAKIKKVGKSKLRFEFIFSDGSELETNLIELPSLNNIITQSVAAVAAGGSLLVYDNNTELDRYNKFNFLNATISENTDDDTILDVDVKTRIGVYDGTREVTTEVNELIFEGGSVLVRPEQVIENWDTLSEVTDLATFGGDPKNAVVEIYDNFNNIKQIAADYDLQVNDATILVDTTLGDVTINLLENVTGRFYQIIKTSSDSNVVYLNGIVNGVTDDRITIQYEAVKIQNYGLEYFKL